MKILRFGVKILKRFFQFFLIFLGIYFLVALILSVWPYEKKIAKTEEKPIEIFIITNGIHADFTVPFKSEYFDWETKLNLNDYGLKNTAPIYVSFGWGDRNFFLETPTWADLTIKNFCHSLFWNSPTAMHVSLWKGRPIENNSQKSINLQPAQYQSLINFILNGFEQNETADFTLIPAPGYSNRDRFYVAKGSYHCFRTCNVWVNEGLKEIGVKTSVWSPLDKGIFWHLR